MSSAILSGSAEILADGSARAGWRSAPASLDTKHAKRDKHLRSADFFNADEHPQIIVDVTTATRSDGDNVAASGTLTVAGQTKPLTLTAAITEAHATSPSRCGPTPRSIAPTSG